MKTSRNKKYTTEEAKEKTQSLNNGFVMVGDYLGSHTKTLFQCHCGKEFYCRPHSIWSKNAKSCGCITKGNKMQDIVGQKFDRLTIKAFSHKSQEHRTYWLCSCTCGNETVVSRNALVSGKTKSCGCIRKEKNKERFFKDITNQKFGRLTAIRPIRQVDRTYIWECKCSCGQVVELKINTLTTGHTKSCGCYRIDLDRAKLKKRMIGVKSGNLEVIDYSHSKKCKGGSHAHWVCLCKCGNYTTASTGQLLSKKGLNVKSCGNCGLFVNGVRVSYKQLELHRLIGKGHVNFQSGRYFIDIALLYGGCKIAIEYNGQYWHKRYGERDKHRQQVLINGGWKVLNINSNYSLPTIGQVYQGIDDLIYSDKKVIDIFLSDWK